MNTCRPKALLTLISPTPARSTPSAGAWRHGRDGPPAGRHRVTGTGVVRRARDDTRRYAGSTRCQGAWPRQRALIAAETILPALEQITKEKERLSPGRPKKGETHVSQVIKRAPQARKRAADLMGVAESRVSTAKRIVNGRSPDLANKVRNGEIRIPGRPKKGVTNPSHLFRCSARLWCRTRALSPRPNLG